MKRILPSAFLVGLLVFLMGCSAKSIQETYWSAGTSYALEEEAKGNIAEAEKELRIAVGRAKLEGLGDEKVASSLYNLGSFYRRQDRVSDAIDYLREALKWEEKVSGPTSERTGRVLAELAASYYMEGNLYEGRPYADRLKPLAHYYAGNEALVVQRVVEAYEIDMEAYQKQVAEWKPLADAGDPKAQYILAKVYFDGPDAEKRMDEILALYQSSANQNYADAQ